MGLTCGFSGRIATIMSPMRDQHDEYDKTYQHQLCADATTGPALRNACAIASSRSGPPGPCKLASLCDESGRCCGTSRAPLGDVLRE